MNLKGNAAPEARGATPFQHSNIYYDTYFSQNAAVAIFQKGLFQKCGKCGTTGHPVLVVCSLEILTRIWVSKSGRNTPTVHS